MSNKESPLNFSGDFQTKVINGALDLPACSHLGDNVLDLRQSTYQFMDHIRIVQGADSTAKCDHTVFDQNFDMFIMDVSIQSDLRSYFRG